MACSSPARMGKQSSCRQQASAIATITNTLLVRWGRQEIIGHLHSLLGAVRTQSRSTYIPTSGPGTASTVPTGDLYALSANNIKQTIPGN